IRACLCQTIGTLEDMTLISERITEESAAFMIVSLSEILYVVVLFAPKVKVAVKRNPASVKKTKKLLFIIPISKTNAKVTKSERLKSFNVKLYAYSAYNLYIKKG
ncbi:MAG: hypothetical protein IK042_05900, partial [Bacteroidales bacterium]|nr:hypothetical protein [Bacteroidales bacterium]